VLLLLGYGEQMARTVSSDFKYELSIRWSPDDRAFTVRVPELPGCVTHGDSVEEAAAHAREAIAAYLESLASRGLPVPTPLCLVDRA
jgi:predicted RNase H-like HicB family nuclease